MPSALDLSFFERKRDVVDHADSSSTPTSLSPQERAVITARRTSLATEVLQSAMNRFVVRMARQRHVSPSTRIENADNGLENLGTGRQRAARGIGAKAFLRNVVPDAAILSIA